MAAASRYKQILYVFMETIHTPWNLLEKFRQL